MIAIGAQCGCGWGPKDVVDLHDAVKYLENLVFIVKEHSKSCPSLIVQVVGINDLEPWKNPRAPHPDQCSCGHLHPLQGSLRRLRQCQNCPCRIIQPLLRRETGNRVAKG